MRFERHGSAALELEPTLTNAIVRPASEPPPSGLVHEREQALRRWLRDYADHVSQVLRAAGTPAHDLDDAVQRTFIVAARRFADVRAGSERAFLVKTALHVAAHARRSAARRREQPTDELPETIDSATPEELTSSHREQRLLRRLLERLLPELRTVLLLHEVEELTMAEIAAELRIPPGTVASRLRRARSELRQRFRAAGALLVATLLLACARAAAAASAAARSALLHLGAPQVVLGVAALGAVAIFAAPRASSPPARPLAQVAAASPPASSLSSRSSVAAAAPVAVELPVTPAAAVPAKSLNPPAARAPSGAEALRLELAQLDRARAALAAGRADAALVTLDAYERSTPRAVLRLEAEVLRIDALSRSGRTAQARARAAAFLARHPKSVLAARVRQLAAP